METVAGGRGRVGCGRGPCDEEAVARRPLQGGFVEVTEEPFLKRTWRGAMTRRPWPKGNIFHLLCRHSSGRW
jgi:hypothetical protein